MIATRWANGGIRPHNGALEWGDQMGMLDEPAKDRRRLIRF